MKKQEQEMKYESLEDIEGERTYGVAYKRAYYLPSKEKTKDAKHLSPFQQLGPRDMRWREEKRKRFQPYF